MAPSDHAGGSYVRPSSRHLNCDQVMVFSCIDHRLFQRKILDIKTEEQFGKTEGGPQSPQFFRSIAVTPSAEGQLSLNGEILAKSSEDNLPFCINKHTRYSVSPTVSVRLLERVRSVFLNV